MKKYEYSVLQYCPSVVSGERINIGILIYCPEDNKSDFIYIKGSEYKRLQAFDDEVNTETIKAVLSLICDDIKELCSPSLLNSEQNFNIKEYIKYFCNEYKFTPITSIEYENIDEAKDELKNIYLRFYIPKNKRKNKKLEYKFLEKLMIQNSMLYDKNKKIKDENDFDIAYDYVLKDFNYGIKIFYLNPSTLKQKINSLRAWAWNCEHGSLKNNIFIYILEYDSFDNKIIKSALNILENATKYVYNFNDVSDLFEDFKY